MFLFKYICHSILLFNLLVVFLNLKYSVVYALIITQLTAITGSVILSF